MADQETERKTGRFTQKEIQTITEALDEFILVRLALFRFLFVCSLCVIYLSLLVKQENEILADGQKSMEKARELLCLYDRKARQHKGIWGHLCSRLPNRSMYSIFAFCRRHFFMVFSLIELRPPSPSPRLTIILFALCQGKTGKWSKEEKHALASQDHHLVSGFDPGNLRHIEHRLVHAHAAHKGRSLAAHQQAEAVAQPPVESVGVTRRHERQPHRLRGHKGAVIAHHRAGWNRAPVIRWTLNLNLRHQGRSPRRRRVWGRSRKCVGTELPDSLRG